MLIDSLLEAGNSGVLSCPGCIGVGEHKYMLGQRQETAAAHTEDRAHLCQMSLGGGEELFGAVGIPAVPSGVKMNSCG